MSTPRSLMDRLATLLIVTALMGLGAAFFDVPIAPTVVAGTVGGVISHSFGIWRERRWMSR